MIQPIIPSPNLPSMFVVNIKANKLARQKVKGNGNGGYPNNQKVNFFP